MIALYHGDPVVQWHLPYPPVAVQNSSRRIGRDRLEKIEARGLLAAILVQDVRLLGRLHAHSHRTDVHRPCKAYHRSDEPYHILPSPDPADERAPDLEKVDPEPTEMR